MKNIKLLIVKVLVVTYSIMGAILIAKIAQDSADIFVVCLHLLAAYLYTKEVINLINIKQYLKNNHKKIIVKKTDIVNYEKEYLNNELQLTKIFNK